MVVEERTWTFVGGSRFERRSLKWDLAAIRWEFVDWIHLAVYWDKLWPDVNTEITCMLR
jgi:hypothetical protein